MTNKTIEIKENQFNQVFLAKCEEIDKKIENIWNEIITDEKKDNIYNESNDYEVNIDKMWLNVYKTYEENSNALFDFTNTENDKYVNCLNVSNKNPYIRYFTANVADIEISNEDMLDPITDSEYEFGVNVTLKEVIDRKIEFLQVKAEFLKYSKEYGKTIFDKYYKLIEDKINNNINYIEKSIDDINNMII